MLVHRLCGVEFLALARGVSAAHHVLERAAQLIVVAPVQKGSAARSRSESEHDAVDRVRANLDCRPDDVLAAHMAAGR